MNITSANRLELLQIAESVSHEKNIDRELVIEAMEEAMARAAKLQYGLDLDIRASYDMTTGELTIERVRTVVESVEDFSRQIELSDALREREDASVGMELIEKLPPMSVDQMDRIVVQNAKQVIVQKIREAERDRQFEEFKDMVGTILVGTVNREEFGNIVVDVTVGEAVIPRNARIGSEKPQKGERIRAMITDVSRETRGPQVKLSRTAPEFMKELFRSEVPEFYEGTIDIRAIARDPGSRAKIAVVSYDASIDPVGACVGMRGSRVQAVVNELQGERIDVIPWTDNLFEFVTYALQPANISKGILDDEGRPIAVVVPDDQLSLAIGKRGQNVRLARSLTGLDIQIMTETDERERRQRQFAESQQLIMDAIDVDMVFAQLLVSEGFHSIEYLAECDEHELLSCNGIDEQIAEELKRRARNYIQKENEEALEEARRFGLRDDLMTFEGLSPKMLLSLAKQEILTLRDFAECADWELAGGYVTVNGRRVKDEGLLEEFELTLEEAQSLVMSARMAAGIVEPTDAVLPDEADVQEETSDEGEIQIP